MIFFLQFIQDSNVILMFEIEKFVFFSFRILTEKPHLAGTPADKENAEYVKEQWDKHGLDSAKVVPYNVLLSYPEKDQPNLVGHI